MNEGTKEENSSKTKNVDKIHFNNCMLNFSLLCRIIGQSIDL